MTPVEITLFLIKWTHGIAAVTWVGGSIFYFMVLTPLISKGEINGIQSRNIAKGFGFLVRICIGILVLSGSLIMHEDLTSPHANSQYIATLLIKISFSMAMFFFVWRQGRRRISRPQPDKSASQGFVTGALPSISRIPLIILSLGIITFLLSDLLAIIFLRSAMAN